MKLEVRVPISPHPAWYRRTGLIAASIREFYPDTLVRVSVGSPDLGDLAKYPPPNYPGVVYNIVDLETFNQWRGTEAEYLATMMDRYKPPFFGDHILMLDADVICVRRFDEMFALPGLSGVMAHVPPLTRESWIALFQGFGLGQPTEWQEHSGWGTMITDEALRYSPPYFNSGVVFGPRSAFEAISEPYFRSLPYIRRMMDNVYWIDQIGFALGVAGASQPVRVLPPRYNFPNQADFDVQCSPDLADIRFLHYLRTNIVHRDRDFMSEEAVRALVARSDLVGSNEVLRARVADLLDKP